MRETKFFPYPPSLPLTSSLSVDLKKIHQKEVAEKKLQDSLWEKCYLSESDMYQSVLELIEPIFRYQFQIKAYQVKYIS